MDVTSTIEFNMLNIEKIEKAMVNALINTGDMLMGEIRDAQVVPYDTGNLNGESFFLDIMNADDGYVSLIHSTPYARRLYYHPEYNFQTTYHANAKGRWFEDWLPGGEKEDDAALIYQSMLRKEMSK